MIPPEPLRVYPTPMLLSSWQAVGPMSSRRTAPPCHLYYVLSQGLSNVQCNSAPEWGKEGWMGGEREGGGQPTATIPWDPSGASASRPALVISPFPDAGTGRATTWRLSRPLVWP